MRWYKFGVKFLSNFLADSVVNEERISVAVIERPGEKEVPRGNFDMLLDAAYSDIVKKFVWVLQFNLFKSIQERNHLIVYSEASAYFVCLLFSCRDFHGNRLGSLFTMNAL